MASQAGPSTAAYGIPEAKPDARATSVIVIGMAGSGKSTFVEALSKHPARTSSAKHKPESYFVNLDPAVRQVAYEPNVDIRDTVDYSRLMQEYNLGPNGAILTALNLFTTKFDQVLGILERRSGDVDQIVMDTPGQIEIFTWSASGSIITDALASSMPTCVAYIIDTPRSMAPATFMSNMLYACRDPAERDEVSIMYKTKLPFVVVFNKIDLQPHELLLEWMNDFETFQAALQGGDATDSVAGKHGRRKTGADGEEGSYMNSLMNSMALVLDEFYRNLRTLGVSSSTGEGIDAFHEAVASARQEFLEEYKPDLERMQKERVEKREKDKKTQLDKLMKDMNVGSKGKPGQEKERGDADEEDEEEIEAQYEGDGQIMEPDDEDLGQDDEEEADDFAHGGGFAKAFGSNARFQDDGTAWPRPA
ncbi:hypothetical protein FA10DRAFT_293993 [Acaromyces ingoldii]|uniref:GPN-loop GTPase n=1 Tax=Acaromyces ingoldii TaxID=215250 RepID=A0A316YRG7_9BASI|nr:hypothetical protein FA10DRAFT_293993 [Acaromyces ingoldii]PWN90375.1 hypothetical protein FA10DRAFT_293993 [Acaromyces ingoldii]